MPFLEPISLFEWQIIKKMGGRSHR